MHEYKTFGFDVTQLDHEGRTLEGYGAVFGNVDQGKDIIHPGAFTKTLAERGNRLKFLWQHETREPLGRILEAREDPRGLFIKAVVSDTQRGRDALALLRDGAIDGLSIGYDAVTGGTNYAKTEDGDTIRNLRELKLFEVSLVSFPMNEAATVTALKADAAPEAPTLVDALAETVADLKARVEALETKSAPAEDAGRVDEPQTAEAGPGDPPTSHAEAALKELEILLKIL